MNALAVLLFLVAGAVVMVLIASREEPFEVRSWRALRVLRQRERWAREDARAHVTFVPFAWRVVRRGRLVKSINPRDVSGVRVVGGEELAAFEWMQAYSNEVVSLDPLRADEQRGGTVH